MEKVESFKLDHTKVKATYVRKTMDDRIVLSAMGCRCVTRC